MKARWPFGVAQRGRLGVPAGVVPEELGTDRYRCLGLRRNHAGVERLELGQSRRVLIDQFPDAPSTLARSLPAKSFETPDPAVSFARATASLTASGLPVCRLRRGAHDQSVDVGGLRSRLGVVSQFGEDSRDGGVGRRDPEKGRGDAALSLWVDGVRLRCREGIYLSRSHCPKSAARTSSTSTWVSPRGTPGSDAVTITY
jgi:hypothetical protein